MSLAFLIGLLLPSSHDPDPAVSATVWVRAGNRATGAGWVVDRERRWVITAAHVLGDQSALEVSFHTCLAGRHVVDRDDWLKNRAFYKAAGRIAGAKVVATAVSADLALLQADHLPDDIPALSLARPAPAGTKCHVVGHRHDAPILWVRTDGLVRQSGRLTDGYFSAGQKIGASSAVVYAQLPVELGDSGGAVVDPAGRVVGVVSAVAERTAGLTILTAADEVGRFLARARGEEKQPPATPAKIPPLQRATVWVRPTATDGRFAGVLIDHLGQRVLTSATAVGPDDVIDVIFPVLDEDEKYLIAEVDAYADRLALSLSRHRVRAVVLARDPARDLALLEVRSVPDSATAVLIAKTDPPVGAAVASVSHPPGLELMWLSAAGTVRGVGAAVLQRDPTGAAARVPSLLLQLPHQGSAAGGPVVDERGDLVGILAGREAARQELGYSARTADVRAFLESARPLAAPRTAAEWHRRGTYLGARGDPQGSIAAHRRAAVVALTDAVYQAAYALAAAENGPEEPVQDVLARLETLPKRSADVDASLAAAYLATGRKEDARRAADRALRGDSKQPLARVVQSTFLGTGDAIRLLDQLLIDNPSFGRAYLERAARLRSVEGGTGKALADATRAEELAPHDPAARILRAELLGEANEWKKAAREYARLLEDRPLQMEFKVLSVRAHLKAGEDGSALTALAELVRFGDGGTEAAFSLIRDRGSFLLREDRDIPTRALEWYQRALQGIRVGLPSDARKRVTDLIQDAGIRSPAAAERRITEELKRWEKAK